MGLLWNVVVLGLVAVVGLLGFGGFAAYRENQRLEQLKEEERQRGPRRRVAQTVPGTSSSARLREEVVESIGLVDGSGGIATLRRRGNWGQQQPLEKPADVPADAFAAESFASVYANSNNIGATHTERMPQPVELSSHVTETPLTSSLHRTLEDSFGQRRFHTTSLNSSAPSASRRATRSQIESVPESSEADVMADVREQVHDIPPMDDAVSSKKRRNEYAGPGDQDGEARVQRLSKLRKAEFVEDAESNSTEITPKKQITKSFDRTPGSKSSDMRGDRKPTASGIKRKQYSNRVALEDDLDHGGSDEEAEMKLLDKLRNDPDLKRVDEEGAGWMTPVTFRERKRRKREDGAFEKATPVAARPKSTPFLARTSESVLSTPPARRARLQSLTPMKESQRQHRQFVLQVTKAPQPVLRPNLTESEVQKLISETVGDSKKLVESHDAWSKKVGASADNASKIGTPAAGRKVKFADEDGGSLEAGPSPSASVKLTAMEKNDQRAESTTSEAVLGNTLFKTAASTETGQQAEPVVSFSGFGDISPKKNGIPEVSSISKGDKGASPAADTVSFTSLAPLPSGSPEKTAILNDSSKSSGFSFANHTPAVSTDKPASFDNGKASSGFAGFSGFSGFSANATKPEAVSTYVVATPAAPTVTEKPAAFESPKINAADTSKPAFQFGNLTPQAASSSTNIPLSTTLSSAPEPEKSGFNFGATANSAVSALPKDDLPKSSGFSFSSSATASGSDSVKASGFSFPSSASTDSQPKSTFGTASSTPAGTSEPAKPATVAFNFSSAPAPSQEKPLGAIQNSTATGAPAFSFVGTDTQKESTASPFNFGTANDPKPTSAAPPAFSFSGQTSQPGAASTPAFPARNAPASSFGAVSTTSSPFGPPAASTSFGSQTTAGPFVSAGNTAGSSASAAFGGFGTTNTSSTSFGSSTQQVSSAAGTTPVPAPAFGGNTGPGNAFGSGFGSTQTNAFGSTATPSPAAFGSQAPANGQTGNTFGGFGGHSQPSSTFSFGATTSNPPAPSAAAAPSFSFGQQANTNTATSSPFGGTAAASTTPSFQFGAENAFGTNQPTSSGSAPAFSFGSGQQASQPGGGFAFGAQQSAASASAGGMFQFGGSSGSAPSTAGATFNIGAAPTERKLAQPKRMQRGRLPAVGTKR